jgi:cephalosporin hydroxylase
MAAELQCENYAVILTIDTEAQLLTVRDTGTSAEFPLYGRKAFELLSREWVRVGWAVRYYNTFTWFGQPVLQLPEDLIRLQECIWTLRPDVIIETGVFRGGSLLFHASLCEALGNGRVIGIDKAFVDDTRSALLNHRFSSRIELIEGDSAAPSTLEQVRKLIRKEDKVMVILDSHHSADHVARELEAYAPLVSEGCCMIAADGIMRDLADVPGGEADWVENNPATAAHTFAAAHPEFEMRQPAWLLQQEVLRENVTYWSDGWLWKKSQVQV